MPVTCTTTVSPDGKYIIQKIIGELDAETALEFNRKGQALGRQLGINRYLVDITESPNNDSIIDNYNFAYKDMPVDTGIDRFARVVALVAPEDHSHDFVEVACRNAGFDFTLFRDRDEAIRHLLGE